ncbi:MAG TPA: beta-ketoacyl-ACP reductase [Candidatus Riflebacteria bacterium]|nr:beta-ketoacyl-ACP reductase [Candidatus Riflebacteria bacterium]
MLKGKTVFITGGTGYIGSELVRTFAGYGARVIFSFNRGADKAEKLAGEVAGSESVKMNMRDVKEITHVVEQLYARHEKIDILVNNAAISQVMPLAMLDEDDVDEVLAVNMKGLIFVTKAVVRGMIRNKSGVIINMGSIAGQRILDVPLTYAMTKAAVNGMTFSLAAELKRFNIRVNSVIPGLLAGGVARAVPDDLRDDFIKHCAVGRAGTAADIAELAAFLASDKASYINGQNIASDGGI